MLIKNPPPLASMLAESKSEPGLDARNVKVPDDGEAGADGGAK